MPTPVNLSSYAITYSNIPDAICDGIRDILLFKSTFIPLVREEEDKKQIWRTNERP
jgi:hypothetical protein